MILYYGSYSVYNLYSQPLTINARFVESACVCVCTHVFVTSSTNMSVHMCHTPCVHQSICANGPGV